MGEFHNAVVDGAGAMTTAGWELQSQMGAGIVVAGAVAAAGSSLSLSSLSLPLCQLGIALSIPPACSSILFPRAVLSLTSFPFRGVRLS